jgi:hypothetical protein
MSGCRLEGLSSNPLIIFAVTFQPFLGPTQPLVAWVLKEYSAHTVVNLSTYLHLMYRMRGILPELSRYAPIACCFGTGTKFLLTLCQKYWYKYKLYFTYASYGNT